MRNIRAAIAATMLLAGSAMAADDDKSYGLKQSEPTTGTAIRQKMAKGSSIPMDLRYDQMTPEQQAAVKSVYDRMPADDEPPFPAGGMSPVVKALLKGAGAYHVYGLVDLTVEVGPDGTARGVSAYALPDDADFRQFVVSLVMVTRYKPAVCAGKPCVMSWPLQLEIVRP